MVITADGQAGVAAVRLADAGLRSESELATIHCPPMAGKIATSRDWELVTNTRTVLNDLVRVSSHLVAISTFYEYPVCNLFLTCF